MPAGWNFGPDAVSFISSTDGWALGDVGCFRCAHVFHTNDAGRHWVTASRPMLPGSKEALLEGNVDMYFANTRDGYIFTGRPCQNRCLIASRDGGRSWQSTPAPAVGQLVSGGEHIYALTQTEQGEKMLRTTAGSAHWTSIPLPSGARTSFQHGSGPSLRLAAEGTTVALLQPSSAGTSPRPDQLGRLWLSTTSADSWLPKPNPCQVADGGAALVSVARAHPNALLIDCFDNKQAQQAINTQHHLYGSADGGTHWLRLGDPPQIGDPELLADNGSGHAFLATESGGANFLMATLDGAAHWHHAIISTAGFYGWADLRFTDTNTGFILGPTHYARTHLYRTQDAGRSWHTIPLPDVTR